MQLINDHFRDLVHRPENHELYIMATDKLTSKQHVADKVGEQYVAPLLATGKTVEEVMEQVDLDEYILKYNLNSLQNTFVKNGIMTQPEIMEIPDRPFSKYFWEAKRGTEHELFFAEEILSKDIVTYNCYCYMGEIMFIEYCHDVHDDLSVLPKMNCVDDVCVSYPELEQQEWIAAGPPKNPAVPIPEDKYKPWGSFWKTPRWEELEWLVRKLAAPFPVVRCDIFDTGDRLVFSEFTATFRSYDLSEGCTNYLRRKIYDD